MVNVFEKFLENVTEEANAFLEWQGDYYVNEVESEEDAEKIVKTMVKAFAESMIEAETEEAKDDPRRI